MGSNSVNDMQELFRQAAEIAKVVPESMQAAAFNRALDMLSDLLDATFDAVPNSHDPHANGDSAAGRGPRDTKRLHIDLFMQSLTREQHPGITRLNGILEQSLMMLQLAVGHEIDGLTPAEICRVLTEKFRVRATSAAINSALGAAPAMAHRERRGAGYEYKLLRPGEAHLAKLLSGTKKPSPGTKLALVGSGKSGNSGNSASKSPGPKQLLGELIADGFFTKPRLVREIVRCINETHNRDYRAANVSPALSRLCRDKAINRSKNAAGRYEYFV